VAGFGKRGANILRARGEMTLHFRVLKRLAGKVPRCRNIDIFLRFGNAARQDASAQKCDVIFCASPYRRSETSNDKVGAGYSALTVENVQQLELVLSGLKIWRICRNFTGWDAARG
jgi:hypothetical protein